MKEAAHFGRQYTSMQESFDIRFIFLWQACCNQLASDNLYYRSLEPLLLSIFMPDCDLQHGLIIEWNVDTVVSTVIHPFFD